MASNGRVICNLFVDMERLDFDAGSGLVNDNENGFHTSGFLHFAQLTERKRTWSIGQLRINRNCPIDFHYKFIRRPTPNSLGWPIKLLLPSPVMRTG